MQEKKVTYQELARQAQKKEKHQIVLAIADGKIRELFQTAKEGEEISFLTTADRIGHDTGIGIPAAEQGRIFERFYRVDKSHSKAVGGTGVGLSIVKHGAALHHATISVSSEPEQGTEITLTFPAA